LRRHGIGPAVLLSWLLAVLAALGNLLLLMVSLAQDLQEKGRLTMVAASLIAPALSLAFLGQALRFSALGRLRDRPGLLPPTWHLLFTALLVALSGAIALLVLDPAVTGMALQHRFDWATALAFAQLGLFLLLWLTMTLLQWVRRRHAPAQHGS
jgi:hypothetical protein